MAQNAPKLNSAACDFHPNPNKGVHSTARPLVDFQMGGCALGGEKGAKWMEENTRNPAPGSYCQRYSAHHINYSWTSKSLIIQLSVSMQLVWQQQELQDTCCTNSKDSIPGHQSWPAVTRPIKQNMKVVCAVIIKYNKLATYGIDGRLLFTANVKVTWHKN